MVRFAFLCAAEVKGSSGLACVFVGDSASVSAGGCVASATSSHAESLAESSQELEAAASGGGVGSRKRTHFLVFPLVSTARDVSSSLVTSLFLLLVFGSRKLRMPGRRVLACEKHRRQRRSISFRQGAARHKLRFQIVVDLHN